MGQKGLLSGAISAAAGIVLSLAAFGLANIPGRNIDRLQQIALAAEPAADFAAIDDSGPLAAAAFCFDPVRPPSPEVMQWIMNEMANVPGADFNLGGGSWTASAGTPPVGLTWSFVPDGTQVPGLSSSTSASTLFATMDAKFGGNRQLWISKFQSVFDRWQAVSGVSYTRVTNNGTDWDDGASFPNAGGSSTPGSTRGHIRISMRSLDGGNGVLAFNYYPTTGDMVIDSAESWQNSFGDYRFLRNTISHEHGHGLGIAHVCPIGNSKLMEPFLSTSFDGPQHDDFRAAHARYGDWYEPNGTFSTATNLGALSFGVQLTPSAVSSPLVSQGTITSIDRLADVDWYKFTVPSTTLLDVSVLPRGLTYMDGPQLSNGQCSSGTARNTLIASDLTLAVYASNGTTVLQSANATPAGQGEALNAVILPSAGTYYVRVGGVSSNQPQLYDLRLTGNPGSACPVFTDQPIGQDLCSGQTIVLYANALGAPTPSFQWRKNGVDLPGETDTALIIPNANSSHAGTYTCYAENSCGNDLSDPAVVTVTDVVTFASHPQSITVPLGGTAAFSVSVNGQGANYEWRKNGSPISGATGPSYQINSVVAGDAGDYTCRIYNNCTDTVSNAAVLTIGGSTCYANCDGSTAAPVLNVADFGCFLQKFAAGDPYANCDGSTAPPVLNVADFGCFLQAFTQGCP